MKEKKNIHKKVYFFTSNLHRKQYAKYFEMKEISIGNVHV